MNCLLRARWNASNAGRLLALSLCLGNVATASVRELLGPSGSVRGALFESDKRYSDRSPVSTGSVWLNLKPEDVRGLRTFFEGYVYWESPEHRAITAGDVREAYGEYSLGPVDLRAGRQVIVWGRADKVNPTDSLTVRDQRLLFTDDEEQRLGTAAVRATWNFEAFQLSAVWQPEWRRPRFAFPALPNGISLVQRDPRDVYRQFALKLDKSGGAFDMSASYFDGYDKTPDFAVDAAGPAGTVLALIHRPIQVIGGDFATTWGAYGVRAEAAYTITQDRSGNDPFTKNRFLAGVLGADRNLFENFNVNAQYLVRYTQDFQPTDTVADPNARAVAVQTQFVANQTRRWLHGTSVRINYKALNETLEMETALVAWWGRGDFLLRPKVTYAFSDQFRGSFGAEWYEGTPTSFFGRLRGLSTGWAEARFLF